MEVKRDRMEERREREVLKRGRIEVGMLGWRTFDICCELIKAPPTQTGATYMRKLGGVVSGVSPRAWHVLRCLGSERRGRKEGRKEGGEPRGSQPAQPRQSFNHHHHQHYTLRPTVCLLAKRRPVVARTP
ncbi:hypothetical protein Pcinc_043416 [Petrolisthes cinctipes]|uniref:Uncharacterized protein n=1 Tax=Petrolisthes cinctipes TaxID=88211 RepID=A0AAE1BFY5_PETCI|nr:hypothetical protein Pcinc_043416 [Petrolisthes cinctipes]